MTKARTGMLIKKIGCLCLICLLSYFSRAQKKDPVAAVYSTTDSVVTFASSAYEPHSFLRRLFMGNNYRRAWQTYVTLPVFHFSRSRLKIDELGGGMQTKSLHLIDNSGKRWSLRTVDKDVSKALPPIVRNTLVRLVSQDFVSGAFPYGPTIAGELVNAVGIRAPRPQVFFVADDTALGPYRSIFANTVCTLEERDAGYKDTDNSEKLLENLTQDNRYKVHQPTLLKARLLDMLMGDWDRHADNWRWGERDSAGLKYYYAIPRDRDWVFFQSKGWIPKAAKLSGAMRFLVNFNPDLKQLKNLSWKSWTMDKNLLNEMDATDWEAAIQEVQTRLSNRVIEAAVRKLPSSIYDAYGASFIHTLLSRRDNLREEAMKYYRFLAEEVLINGSDGDETFAVFGAGDSLIVRVYRHGLANQKIYERSFSSAETYFITLHGKGGNDIFKVDNKVKSRIRLVIHGGEGADQYDIKGDIRTKIYDAANNNNVILTKGVAKLFFD